MTTYKIPFNPVGSRSVSRDMGFSNPYDVDKAGRRAEFERRLINEKFVWEMNNEDFVTDRTTFDNLAYTMLHDVSAITDDIIDRAILGMKRYTHVLYCPSETYLRRADDPHRMDSSAYHKVYDAALHGLITKYSRPNLLTLVTPNLGERKKWIEKFLDKSTT